MSLLARIPLLRSILPPKEHSLRYKDDEDRRALIRSRVLALATTAAGSLYIWWLLGSLNAHHPWIAAAFVTAEILCLALFVTATFTVWRLRFKPPGGLPISSPGSVDVFVTVCGEALYVVRATLDAAAVIDWSGPLTVYVLDDGGSDEVRAIARRHGFTYISRPQSERSVASGKAGNLNFGLQRSDGEFILVLDADQVPQPNILRVLAGYMRFSDVAFIQSRQSFYVPDGDPFFNLDRVFYEAVQLGYDDRDNALSCGSGVLYRRAALSDNGGFSTWNVVEDLTTSYDLHSRGWRSFYYSHAVTKGIAPSDIWGVYRQRGQWCLDTMRIFFWDNPLFKRGLRWSARMSYLVIPLSYLNAGFVFPFFFVIPAWVYLTGGSVLSGSELEFALYRSLYFLVMTLALRTLFRKHETGRQFQMLAGLFPMYAGGTIRALFYPPRRRAPYRPNNAVQSVRRRPALLGVLPQMALIAVNAALPFYAILNETAEPRLILSSALISAIAMWSLLPTVFAALATKTWNADQSPYAAYQQPAQTRS
jgi:cellulose synthase (UDP-forming)